MLLVRVLINDILNELVLVDVCLLLMMVLVTRIMLLEMCFKICFITGYRTNSSVRILPFPTTPYQNQT